MEHHIQTNKNVERLIWKLNDHLSSLSCNSLSVCGSGSKVLLGVACFGTGVGCPAGGSFTLAMSFAWLAVSSEATLFCSRTS